MIIVKTEEKRCQYLVVLILFRIFAGKSVKYYGYSIYFFYKRIFVWEEKNY